MMSRSFRFGLGIVLASGLAACTQSAVDTPYVGAFDPTMLHYAAGKGDLYTQVVGNPFNASKADVEHAVTGAMFRSHFGPDVRFTTERDPDNTSPYRVVVMFNPAPALTPRDLCMDAQQTGQAATGTVRVMLAFCSSDYRETSVTGRIAGVTDPNDPSFRGLIRQMTVQLFPPRNPDALGGGSDFNT